MFIVRAIKKSDASQFVELAFKAKIGITSLPKNQKHLEELIDAAVQSFEKKVTKAGHEIYLFVLEEIEKEIVGGVCGIYATTDHPIHYFKILNLPLEKAFPETPESIEVLQPVAYASGPTEICSLFLDPKLRKEGLGKLLSFSRFLFMANFPERFEDTVFALMRSYIDEEEENPFWNNVGRKFLDVSFKTLIKRKDEGKDIFPPLLAKFTILVPLLQSDAQKAIGKVYLNTLPALHMLKEQGFTYKDEIDAIDGGPKIEAKFANIKTIRESTVAKIKAIEEIENAANYLISNCKLDFRCCLGNLKIEKNNLVLSKDAANALQVNPGDTIRFVRVS